MTLSFTLALLSVGVAAAWAALRLRRWLELRRIARRFARGLAGQRAARGLLEARGFEVLAEEQVATAEVVVDDERRPFDVRVDFIVRRRRRTYAVEVKTGEQAADPLARATRRQLREYAAVLPVDGVLLLDMEAPRLMQVRFPASDVAHAWPALLIGFALGVALVLSLSCGPPPAPIAPRASAPRDVPRSAGLPTAFRRGVADSEVARWVALLRVPERAVEAVRALEGLGHPSAIPPLCELYNDFASPLILHAIVTLVRRDPGSKLGRAALVGSLRPDPDKYVLAILAADALGDIRATEAVLPLGAVLDLSFGVRSRANLAKLAAIRALTKIRDSRAVPYLRRAVGRTSDPPEVRQAAVEALRRLAAP